MNLIRTHLIGCWALLGLSTWAQHDTLLLAQDEHYVMGDAGEDPTDDLNAYESFNAQLGGDSIRFCGEHPCIAWVEDHYPDGKLKHRGYYDAGRLTVYKNYHTNGAVERDYKAVDAVKSTLRTWHSNGTERSLTRYADGVSYYYEDHYVNGQLRYLEERHRSEPCFTRMELYAADGKPISLLREGKGKLVFEQEEFYPGGALKCKGGSRFNPARMDTQRMGTWTYFDAHGAKVKEEDYVDGKVHTTRSF